MASFIQTIFNTITRSRDVYRLAATLGGHKGAINTLTFNQDSSLLASGGSDEVVKIWDTRIFKNLQTIRDLNGQWGQITCAKFIIPDPSSEYLCFGTGRGHFLIYRRLRKSDDLTEVSNSRAFPTGDSVESFAFDSVHHRLAVTSHHGIIKMCKFNNNNGSVTDLWKEEIQDAIPRAISFADRGDSVNIYGLETGAVVCLDSETGVERYNRTLKSPIGNVASCPLTSNIVVDNMTDGFDSYTLPRTTPMRHFRVPTSKKYIKKAVYAEKGNTIVGGSDHGKVYVFGIQNPEARQTLIHGKKDIMIQTVEATNSASHYIIGSGAASKPFSIRIWQKPIKRVPSQQQRKDPLPVEVLTFLNFILIILLWTSYTWIPVVEKMVKSTARMTVELAHDMHELLPSVPTQRRALRANVDPVETALNLDEDILRRLLGVARMTNDHLHSDDSADDEAIDELA